MRTMVAGDLWWSELKAKVESVERRCAQIERAQRDAVRRSAALEPAQWRELMHGTQIAVLETARAGQHIRKVQSPLDRLHARKSIDGVMWTAGDILLGDYEVGILGAREVDELAERVDCGIRSAGYPVEVIAAVARYRLALAAVGRWLAPVVFSVCVDGRDLAQIAEATEQHPRELTGVLKVGLLTLADHYSAAVIDAMKERREVLRRAG
ncbi:DUF6456 domain-containing protein [Inquilinus sp.]|uniref:DUF6456 domain-containing protein n=1 Tax=Inquilinus sp. TaxID=1932117 RepID=UPI0031CFC435